MSGALRRPTFLSMPSNTGHLLGGMTFAVGGVAAGYWSGFYQPDLVTAGLLVAVAIMAALFPDVDTDSHGQRLYYSMLVAADLLLIIFGQYRWAALLGLFAMFPAVGQHRGWTHTWWAMLVTPLPMLIVPSIFFGLPLRPLTPFYVAAVIGYFSHLALDRKF